MKSIKQLLNSEVFLYLVFGVLATIVYTFTRLLIFSVTKEAILSAVLANIIAVIFAFFTNDYFVFKQARKGWYNRLVRFFGARLFTLLLDLFLAYLLVEKFPQIIGQFVRNQLELVNMVETLFAQVLIIVLNYVISKWFVFK